MKKERRKRGRVQRERNVGTCGVVQENNKHESGVYLRTAQGLEKNPGRRKSSRRIKITDRGHTKHLIEDTEELEINQQVIGIKVLVLEVFNQISEWNRF